MAVGLAAWCLLDPTGAGQLPSTRVMPWGMVALCLLAPDRLYLLLEPYQGARTGIRGFLVGPY